MPRRNISYPHTDMDKPKLLLIGHTYLVAINREKACALSDYFHVRVCTPDLKDWKVLGAQVVDEEDPNHAGKYELKRLARWPRWQKYTKIALRGLAEEFQEFQPDVVLVENEPWSWLRWQARWQAWRRAPHAVFAEFTWENVHRPGLRGLMLRAIYRLVAWTADRVICGNQAAKGLMMVAGVKAEQILVDGQLGIEPDEFPLAVTDERLQWRNRMGWPEDALVIGFCGRLVEEKGLRKLAAAVSALRRDHPKVRLAILGEGHLWDELRAIDPDEQWLALLPPVSHREVAFFLNKLDIFVLPSNPVRTRQNTWEEQFGHVLIEAITAGVLTLGSDSGAIPEVLDDAEVVFRHNDVEALEAILRHWLASENARKAKSAAQREACLLHWSNMAIAGRYARFLMQGLHA